MEGPWTRRIAAFTARIACLLAPARLVQPTLAGPLRGATPSWGPTGLYIPTLALHGGRSHVTWEPTLRRAT
jgi:hypothetical protein